MKIATDGGAIPIKGSLGFVFADEDGTILLNVFQSTIRQCNTNPTVL
jgi:hypothetical protein